MTPLRIQGNEIKHKLRTQSGMTLKDFAEKFGFKARDVSDVVRGIRQGQYGTGRCIADKLKELTDIDLQSNQNN